VRRLEKIDDLGELQTKIQFPRNQSRLARIKSRWPWGVEKVKQIEARLQTPAPPGASLIW
jgi:hypothetical protein